MLIEARVRADLFRHELDAAEELLKKGHLRAAGALSGVTLEFHLQKIMCCSKHRAKKEERDNCRLQ